MAADDQEKTEKATPKRREEARQKGQVVTSRELSSALLILFAVLIFKNLGFDLMLGLKTSMAQSFSTLTPDAMTQAQFTPFMHDLMIRILVMTLPILLLIAFVGGASVVVQHGVLFTTQALMPDWSRINPLSGFARIFSIESVMNGSKTFFKFLVIGAVAYFAIISKLPEVLELSRMTPGAILGLSGDLIASLVLRCGAVVAVIGGADYAFQWWSFEKKLRMSKQEIKEENKQTEGTPQVKSRIRHLQREMARNRMMADVPNADVVITSGGVSVGEADFVKETLDKLGQVEFWKVAMKPGRPLAFGKIKNACFFGLPGNPVSVMVTFYQFVQPALRKMMGESQTETITMKVPSASRLKKRPGRLEYQRGIMERDKQGQLVVRKTGAQGSGILSSMSQANCFIILPIESSTVEIGSLVDVQPFFGLV